MELVCPAGSLTAVKTAIQAGADAIYVGLRDDTNARRFAGLNLDARELEQAVDMAHDQGRRLFLAVNTYVRPGAGRRWERAVELAAELWVDALIVADVGLLAHASRRYPDLPLHLSVQGSATNPEALAFYYEHYGIRRAVLPRVLSLAQVSRVARESPVPVEVFGFGSLCIMAEGRCHLSSYITGESPNQGGACSPASAVRWERDGKVLSSRLNEVLIDRFEPDERAGYPTLCKGRFIVEGRRLHAIEEPTSLNTIDLIPKLAEIGVAAIKIEGRQRSPAYVEKVTRTWREALDAFAATGGDFEVRPQWSRTLAGLSEGSQTTLGAYHRPWQ
jgi:collagenase-like PrtC family protease